MKILKIQFKNIHSLEGEHLIDFQDQRFANSNLFAITGATGSGKSTILDIITLSLYNQMPRMNKISNTDIQKSGAIITKGRSEAYAQVKYQCEKGIFTSEWSIRTKRTGKIDEVQMQLYDHNGTPMFQNKRDIPKANSLNIGLNYGQFVKSIILAQGDFDLFLKSDKKERSAILEQITGTDIYRAIGKKAFEKNKEYKIQLKTLEDYRNNLIQKIIPDTDIQNINLQLQNQQDRLNSVQKELKDTEKELEKKKKELELKQKIADIDQKLQNNKQNKEHFDKNDGIKLYNHLKTTQINDLLNDWQVATDNYNLYQNLCNNKTQEKNILLDRKQQLLNEINSFLNIKTQEHQVQNHLNNFQKEIIALENLKKEKTTQYKEYVSQINTHLASIGLPSIDIKYLHQAQTDLSKKQNDIKNFVTHTQQLLKIDSDEQVKHHINSLKQSIRNLKNAEIICVEIRQNQKYLSEKRTEEQQQQQSIAHIPQQIEKLNDEIQINQLQLDKLLLEKEKNELKKSLNHYRKDLKQGSACPLCGSLHHAYTNEAFVVPDTLCDDIKNQEIALHNKKKELIIKENTLKNTQENIKNIQTHIRNISQEIADKTNTFETSFPDFLLTDNWAEKQQSNENKLDTLEAYLSQKTILTSIGQALPLVRKLESVIEQGKNIKNQLEQKIGNKNVTDEVHKYLQKWSEAETHIQAITHALSEVQSQKLNTQDQLKTTQDQLNTLVHQQGFASIEEALNARLPFDKADELSNIQKQLQEDYTLLTGQKEALTEQYEPLKYIKDKNKEELTQQIQELKNTTEHLNKSITDWNYLIRSDNDNRKELATCQEQITQETQKNKTWRLLDILIGDAEGAKFNKFAQDLTLQQLIKLANKRLTHLSARYLLTYPNENEDDSLIAIDKDMGNQRRSVKTLSGGETFILSLSLALALSDLASNNVKIESLFIDEGFGTLDTETLDQTLDTLEQLQQESHKMIGIISHIESLKERITTQIRITPKGSGFSTLQIVSG